MKQTTAANTLARVIIDSFDQELGGRIDWIGPRYSSVPDDSGNGRAKVM
jgi:hypothetical protein